MLIRVQLYSALISCFIEEHLIHHKQAIIPTEQCVSIVSFMYQMRSSRCPDEDAPHVISYLDYTVFSPKQTKNLVTMGTWRDDRESDTSQRMAKHAAW